VVAYKVFEIMEESGLLPEVLNFLPGTGEEIGAYLVEHPRTRFFDFIGSLEVGTWIN